MSFKEDDSEMMFVRIGILLFAGLFTYFGFFNTQPCDLDNIYLSCRLTGTVGDWIGCILFYSCCAMLAGVPKLFGIELFNPTGSTMWNTITFVGGVLGVILIWEL